ncbi:MAG: ImmA/IrrE family metallo-endopeptidase [Chloroflexi bacterium]|nr:ImmA/IrrE family metallo-endopeptidase [Chloroflexota bacterium]
MIDIATCWAEPIGIVHMRQLTTGSLSGWLGSGPDPVNRELHGALIARRGRGLILVDAGDEEAERRFTIAHEVAHFIIEYRGPRDRIASSLGHAALEVLDGDRPPTTVERVDSLLQGVPLGPYLHLLERGLLRPRDSAEAAEFAADRLALELLAPAREVRRRVGADASRIALEQALECDFGLPREVAGAYAWRFASRVAPSVREWLGI